ncbi:hypothetical protein GWI33_006841 [Rhynchophorus ferrugineus]|uniref:CCHC-type domain-containing protein n=1 Tax=Rhynchophorus ferrugineus TaxID=354439 RepID=A0A834IGY8_RHYFE|nr:hypothetical protein GWI33_006841 [Rhynchophorus ferrugineus]
MRIFEQLKEQLYMNNMFERNFTKVSDVIVQQEVLVVKSCKVNQGNRIRNKFKGKSTCNYCKQPGHWIRQCQKWSADERPSKDVTLKEEKDKTVETNTVLLTTCGEIFSVEGDENN